MKTAEKTAEAFLSGCSKNLDDLLNQICSEDWDGVESSLQGLYEALDAKGYSRPRSWSDPPTA